MVRTFEIYWLDGRLYGYEIEWKSYPRSIEGFERSYLVTGKNATFCLVSHDRSIDGLVAVRFATAIARGTYATVNCNLERVWP
jgi:hypothetical protein